MKSKLLIILLIILFSCSQKYPGEIVFKKINFDSILMNRKEIFDPSIIID